jgi:8-amino-7-oxononanoate synthase
LHVFWDLFALLCGEHASIHIDAAAYPIARWGAERMHARGIPVQSFRHRDPDALRLQLRAAAAQRRKPIVLADGYCPRCGPSPLAAFSALAAEFDGRVVIDDTQALGVLGERAGLDAPFGRGGGGSLRWHGLAATNVAVGASLAKGFGAPLAVLAGEREVVRRFEEHAETRVHCSQPSMAAIGAAARALALNAALGDAARARLAALVRRLRAGLASIGYASPGGFFPVQVLDFRDIAAVVHERLRRLGVCAPLHRDLHTGRPVISFLVTARHDERDIDAAVACLGRALGRSAARVEGMVR